MNDTELLREYVERGSQDAFQELVRRYINLVYTTALREVRDVHLAADVAQAVFVVLLRRAGALGEGVILAAWLFRAARFCAAEAMRREVRRKRHEHEAATMGRARETEPERWQDVEPMLNDAVAALSASDRDVVLLRFFQNKSMRDIGLALGITEVSAKKRVSRAIERLRRFFMRSGVVLSAAVVHELLLTNAVQAAPAGLDAAIGTAVFSEACEAVGSSAFTIAKGAMTMMMIAKMKIAAAWVGMAMLAGGAAMTAEKTLWAEAPAAAKEVVTDYTQAAAHSVQQAAEHVPAFLESFEVFADELVAGDRAGNDDQWKRIMEEAQAIQKLARGSAAEKLVDLMVEDLTKAGEALGRGELAKAAELMAQAEKIGPPTCQVIVYLAERERGGGKEAKRAEGQPREAQGSVGQAKVRREQ